MNNILSLVPLFRSRDVDKHGSVLFRTLHIIIVHQVLDLGLHHLGLCLEHGDVAHHISLHIQEAVLLLRLHYLDDVGLDHESALSIDSLLFFLFFLACTCGLLLDSLCR